MSIFLRKHQRWISFIGASLVLFTFVLREVVRDHYKELASALDQATSIFGVEDQLETLDKRLIRLSNRYESGLRLEETRRMLATGPTFQDTRDGINTVLEEDIDAVENLRSMQRSMERLLHKLPTEDYPPDLKQAHDELLVLIDERNTYENSMSPCEDLKQPNSTCSLGYVDEMDQKTDQLDVKLMLMNFKLSKLSAPVIDDAERVLMQREYYYHLANVASAVFFFLGWALGLIGTIYGIAAFKTRES